MDILNTNFKRHFENVLMLKGFDLEEKESDKKKNRDKEKIKLKMEIINIKIEMNEIKNVLFNDYKKYMVDNYDEINNDIILNENELDEKRYIYFKKFESIRKLLNMRLSDIEENKDCEKYYTDATALREHFIGTKLYVTSAKLKSMLNDKLYKDFIVNVDSIIQKILMIRKLEEESGINLYNLDKQIENYKKKVTIKKETIEYYQKVFNDRSKKLKYETVEDVCKLIYKSYNKLQEKLIEKKEKHINKKEKHKFYNSYSINKQLIMETYNIFKYRIRPINIDRRVIEFLDVKLEINHNYDDFIDD
jgi:hypothetical protein